VAFSGEWQLSATVGDDYFRRKHLALTSSPLNAALVSGARWPAMVP
jgi:hypothetical protein